MTQPALRSRLGGADHEERLARAASGGNRRAFAALYRRYEEPVFSLAFRITGSADLAASATRDAFADAVDALSHLEVGGARFGSSVLLAGRNRSLELTGASQEPGEEPEPEPDDVVEAEQHAIRQAVLGLEEPDREVLALGQVAGLAPGAIAAIMDLDDQAVPELAARARLHLHDELWEANPALRTPPSGDCELALPLMALRDDGNLDDEEDRAWLVEHLAHCRDCRLRLDAMEQAQAAYDRWEPAAPPASLFGEATAAAARFSEDDEKQPVARAQSRRTAVAPALASAGGMATSTLSSARARASRLGSSVRAVRPRSPSLLTAGLILVMLLGLSATLAGATLVLRGDGRSEPTTPQVIEPDAVLPNVVPPPKSQPPANKAKRARSDPQKAKLVVVKPVKPESTKKPQRDKERRAIKVPSAEAVPLPKPKPPPTTPQPAPVKPPTNTTPEVPQPQPAPCKGVTGNTVPCPGG